jgi:Ca2+/Na+ antiporter
MSADIAMTKKGFGEMAITATLAGPVFNILVGMAISNYASYTTNGTHKNE